MENDSRGRTRRSPAKEARWREVIGEWRASGATLPEFAAKRGLSPWTVRWWCTELKKRDRERRPERTEAPAGGPGPTEASIVPVRVVKGKPMLAGRTGPRRWGSSSEAESEKESGLGRGACTIEIVPFGQVRIRVPADFDPRTLRAVLDVLEAPC